MARYGLDAKLLVKLLDTGKRLPIYAHLHVVEVEKLEDTYVYLMLSGTADASSYFHIFFFSDFRYHLLLFLGLLLLIGFCYCHLLQTMGLIHTIASTEYHSNRLTLGHYMPMPALTATEFKLFVYACLLN